MVYKLKAHELVAEGRTATTVSRLNTAYGA